MILKILKCKRSVPYFQPLHSLKNQCLWVSQHQDKAPHYVLSGLCGLTAVISALPLLWPSFLLPNLPGRRSSFTSSEEPSLTSTTGPHPQSLGCLSLTALTLVDILFGLHLSSAYVLLCSASSSTRAENLCFCSILFP